LMLVATPALAGGCCGSGYGSLPMVGIEFLPPHDRVTQIYVVNQGPMLSGPGLYTYTNPWMPSFDPPMYWHHAAFPYVRRSPHRWCPGCGGVASLEPPMYWLAGWRPRHHRW
jgi:hypothetical protein